MDTTASNQVSKLVAIVIGACLCLGALLLWHMPSDARTLGADVRLIETPPGELEIKPAGAVLATRNLEPASPPVHSSFTVANLVGRPLVIQVRGLPSSRVLDDDLQVELTSKGRTLFTGRLGGLRSFAASGLKLPARSKASIDATVSIAPGSEHYRGQILDVPLEFKATPAGSSP